MTSNIMSNNGRLEIKICKNCWYYKPDPCPNENLVQPESENKFPCCDFYNDLNSVKSDDTCENWESKMLKLIRVVKVLYSR
ncbi:MAG: hypothetical protein P8012_03045, partial [Desulfobacterales bacterium]